LIKPAHNKSVTQGARILDDVDFFQSLHQTVPNRCYLTFFHFPERSIALVKTTGWFTKGAEIDQPAPR
jgi:hypothetical protein